MTVRRCALLYNPRAGRWQLERRLAAIVQALGSEGFAVAAEPTGGPGDAGRIASEQARCGAEVVFAFGGDGTLREAAAGLLGTGTALGPLPGGTVNVVPYALGLPMDPVAAAHRLGRGSVREIDVGLCGEEPFLMQASAGLDARALEMVRPATKRRLGRLAVAASAAAQWFRYHYPEIRVAVDGRELSASFVACCNVPFYGGPYRLAPQARLDDRRLDLVVFRGRGPLATLGFTAALAMGRHDRRRDVEILAVEEAQILSPPELPVQLDGDFVPEGPPLRLRLAPTRLKVLSPAP